jgi:hypothetical protein
MFNLFWYKLGLSGRNGFLLRPLLWIISLINLPGWLEEKIIPPKQMSFNHLTVARKQQKLK